MCGREDCVSRVGKFQIFELQSIERKLGYGPSRFLTDLTGPYYPFVMESTYEHLAAVEKVLQGDLSSPESGAWYQKVVPLVESGQREICTIVE